MKLTTLITSTLLLFSASSYAAECDHLDKRLSSFHPDSKTIKAVVAPLCAKPGCGSQCSQVFTIGDMTVKLYRAHMTGQYPECVSAVLNMFEHCSSKGFTEGRWSQRGEFYLVAVRPTAPSPTVPVPVIPIPPPHPEAVGAMEEDNVPEDAGLEGEADVPEAVPETKVAKAFAA